MDKTSQSGAALEESVASASTADVVVGGLGSSSVDDNRPDRCSKSRKGKKSKKAAKKSEDKDKSKDKKKKKKKKSKKSKKTSKEGDDSTAEMSRQATENPDSPEMYSAEDLDLRRPVHTLDHYIDDKKEMLRHVFATVRRDQLQAILPPALKELEGEELKRLCLEQLEQLSDATILRIISGHDDDDWPVTMESSSSPCRLTDAAQDRNDNNKEEESSGKTLMELLELEMRARAIKALLKRQEADDEAAKHLSTRDNRISSSSSSGGGSSSGSSSSGTTSSSGDSGSSSRSNSPDLGGRNPAVRGGMDTRGGDSGHKSAANLAIKRTMDDPEDVQEAKKANQQVEHPAEQSPVVQVDEEFDILDVEIELGVDEDSEL